MNTLSVELVLAIHDTVLNPGELQGLAGDKSLDGALARVENRIAYGMIADVCDLAAAYAEAISQGHCFADGNKRTAFRAMHAALMLNGARPRYETTAIADRIIALAQRKSDSADLAAWLRTQT